MGPKPQWYNILTAPMPGTLFVVATPIGNLEDVTFRAVRILRDVDLIAAEDTRRTAILLRHYQISTPTTSLHEHNEQARTPSLVSRLEAGTSIALVSDAGTPAISDPGYRLIRSALAAGIKVEAIPGPSAILAALVSSGLPTDSFCFVGFPPIRAKAKIKWLEQIANESRTVIFFESPRRLRSTLLRLAQFMGDRPIVVARELTKIHETLVIGPINDVLARLAGHVKGEVTVLVGPRITPINAKITSSADQLLLEYGYITNNEGGTRRDAIRALAARHHLSVREVYAVITTTMNRLKDQL